MMGSGKTTIGRKLALRLDLPFYDTDQMIEDQIGMSIANYFISKGEDAFREQELHLLNNWKTTTGIIATGGGLPCHNENMQKLTALGKVIYLTCNVSTIIERVSKAKNKRPLLSKLSKNELHIKLSTLCAERDIIYSNAHFTINSDLEINRVMEDIMTLLY